MGEEEEESVRRYSELETILLGLDLSQCIPIFSQHNIGLAEFLVLSEADLKVGLRENLSSAGFAAFQIRSDPANKVRI